MLSKRFLSPTKAGFSIRRVTYPPGLRPGLLTCRQLRWLVVWRQLTEFAFDVLHLTIIAFAPRSTTRPTISACE
jgi:hypothetical protein